jgi:hypothetical protein
MKRLRSKSKQKTNGSQKKNSGHQLASNSENSQNFSLKNVSFPYISTYIDTLYKCFSVIATMSSGHL